MAKTFSLSFPNDEAQKIELEAEEKGVNVNQLLRDRIRDRPQPSASPQNALHLPELQQMADQMQQIKEQLDKTQQGMQQILQKPSTAPSPQQFRDAIQPVSDRLQQVEARLGKLCEATEKLAGVLERDRALMPRIIKRQEGFLEAVYVLVEKVLMYTSPEEFRAANQKLVDEMHTELERFLEE